MYNQPTIKLPNGKMVGALYSNPFDCLWKTLRAEGALAWYKGAPISNRLLCLEFHLWHVTLRHDCTLPQDSTVRSFAARFAGFATLTTSTRRHTIVTLTANDLYLGWYRKATAKVQGVTTG